MKAGFGGTFAAGLCAHLYQFTNKLFNFDELYNTPEGTGEGLGLGRFGLYYVGQLVKHFFGNYSLPLINGLVSLLLIAIAACLIIEGLKIRNTLLGALIGGLMAVFPSVTCNFFFLFTSPYYSFALLLACLAPFLILRYQKLPVFFLSVFLLAFATGIYQAYFAVSAAFLVTALILDCEKQLNCACSDKNEFTVFFRRSLLDLVFLFSGLILYILLNKLSIKIYHVELPDYQGLSSMGTIDPVFIGKQMVRSYAHTLHLVSEDVYSLNPTSIIRVCILLLFITAACLLVLTFRNGIRNGHNPLLLLMEPILLLVFPLSLFLVLLMVTPDTYVQAAMLNSAVFSVIMPVAVIDCFLPAVSDPDQTVAKGTGGSQALSNLSGWITLGSVLSIILVYIWYANGNYMALQYADYHDLAYYEVMLSQIKSTKGYTDDTPVIILGQNYTDHSFRAGNLVADTFYLYGTSPTFISAYSSPNLFTKYLGFTPEFLWDDEDELYYNTHPEVIAMPCYPDEGSIRMVDGVIVVKVEDHNS